MCVIVARKAEHQVFPFWSQEMIVAHPDLDPSARSSGYSDVYLTVALDSKVTGGKTNALTVFHCGNVEGGQIEDVGAALLDKSSWIYSVVRALPHRDISVDQATRLISLHHRDWQGHFLRHANGFTWNIEYPMEKLERFEFRSVRPWPHRDPDAMAKLGCSRDAVPFARIDIEGIRGGPQVLCMRFRTRSGIMRASTDEVIFPVVGPEAMIEAVDDGIDDLPSTLRPLCRDMWEDASLEYMRPELQYDVVIVSDSDRFRYTLEGARSGYTVRRIVNLPFFDHPAITYAYLPPPDRQYFELWLRVSPRVAGSVPAAHPTASA